MHTSARRSHCSGRSRGSTLASVIRWECSRPPPTFLHLPTVCAPLLSYAVERGFAIPPTTKCAQLSYAPPTRRPTFPRHAMPSSRSCSALNYHPTRSIRYSTRSSPKMAASTRASDASCCRGLRTASCKGGVKQLNAWLTRWWLLCPPIVHSISCATLPHRFLWQSFAKFSGCRSSIVINSPPGRNSRLRTRPAAHA